MWIEGPGSKDEKDNVDDMIRKITWQSATFADDLNVIRRHMVATLSARHWKTCDKAVQKAGHEWSKNCVSFDPKTKS